MTNEEIAKKHGVPCDTLEGRLEEIERGLEVLSHIADSPDHDKADSIRFVRIALWEHLRAVKACLASAGFNLSEACPTVYSD